MKPAKIPVISRSQAGKLVRIMIIVAVVAGLVTTTRLTDIEKVFFAALAWIDQAGSVGPIVFIGLYIVACMFMLPGSILSLGAGVVFGVVKGSILVSIASTLGATATFLIGRYLIRDWIAAKIEKKATFKAMDEAIGQEGWKIVGLTRLSPLFPFNVLNYAFGITRVSLGQYVLASWIGMMPGTILCVYIGSLARNLATLGAGAADQTPTSIQWAVNAIGFFTVAVITVIITRIARQALTKKLRMD